MPTDSRQSLVYSTDNPWCSDMPYYNRAPSSQLATQLARNEPFRTVLEELTVNGDALDVQFRVNDEVKLYAGGTCPLIVRFFKDEGLVEFDADGRAYRGPYEKDHLSRDGFFGKRWDPREPSLHSAIRKYIAHEVVTGTCRPHQDKEGRIQTRWAGLRDGKPWAPLDREAVIGYRNMAERNGAWEKAKTICQDAWRTLPSEHGPWAASPLSRAATVKGAVQALKQSRELDQIAVDEQGNLVLIELKDASAKGASSTYAAPLQLLQYVHEWHLAAQDAEFRRQLQALVDAKRQLGFLQGLPAGIPTFENGICLRPVVAFGDYFSAREHERQRKFEAALRHVNGGSGTRFLPEGVMPVEAWYFRDGVPHTTTRLTQ